LAAARAAGAHSAGHRGGMMPCVSDILVVDGHAFSWKRLFELRRAQLEAARKAKAAQLALFEARHDRGPAPERTAAGRYLEPGLLERLHR
jgi:hypothetical protein